VFRRSDLRELFVAAACDEFLPRVRVALLLREHRGYEATRGAVNLLLKITSTSQTRRTNMPYGPFTFEITDEASRIEFDELSRDIRDSICSGIKYDPDTHGIYSFSVAPRELINIRSDLTRIQKKRSYLKVDRVLIQATPKHPSITFLGIYPTTVAVSGQSGLDYKGDILFEFGIPKILKFQIKSEIKNKIRSDVFEIFSSRTNRFAQWIFLKKWVNSGGAFDMRVFCAVPDNLKHDDRSITCDAEAQQEGRKVVGIYKRIVRFADSRTSRQTSSPTLYTTTLGRRPLGTDGEKITEAVVSNLGGSPTSMTPLARTTQPTAQTPNQHLFEGGSA
jgi:hypothetical protein